MTGRQIAFEIASRITAGVSIMINIVRQLYVATLFTLVTTAVFGLGYPMLVTGAAQLLFPPQANGSLVERNGQTIGSSLIGAAVLDSRATSGPARQRRARATTRRRRAARIWARRAPPS